jgi:hypothetical protein
MQLKLVKHKMLPVTISMTNQQVLSYNNHSVAQERLEQTTKQVLH